MNQVHGLRDNLRDAETLAENSSNGEQNQAKEKWERDSGMELTSTDSSLQQIMAAASNAMGAARSSNFLELASTVRKRSYVIRFMHGNCRRPLRNDIFC